MLELSLTSGMVFGIGFGLGFGFVSLLACFALEVIKQAEKK